MLIHWADLNRDEFAQYRDNAIVVLNLASIEQHSRHLPVGTDSFIGKATLEKAATMAEIPILMLPQICFGFSPHHRFADGYITISQSTLILLVSDICKNVYENGFRTMFLVTSHGGNST